MPALNGNNVYLSINGKVVGDPTDLNNKLFVSVKPSRKVGEEETTAGSGTEWVDKAAKLQELSLKIDIVYDTDSFATDIAAIQDTTDHIVEIIWGPEGNGSGKPKHQQNFLMSGMDGPEQSVDKTKALISISASSTGAPTANFYAGDTFA